MKSRVSTESENDEIDARYSLNAHDLKMVFFGMLIELFVCFFVFICELITYKWIKRVRIVKRGDSTENALFDYVN